jgi:hypothetical protein
MKNSQFKYIVHVATSATCVKNDVAMIDCDILSLAKPSKDTT